MAGVRASRNPSLQRMGQGGEPHPRATGRSPLQGWILARRTPKTHPPEADVPLAASWTGSRRVESRRGVLDGCDGLAVRGLPPLDPLTALPPRRICDRVSGPLAPGMDSRLGGWNDGGGSMDFYNKTDYNSSRHSARWLTGAPLYWQAPVFDVIDQLRTPKYPVETDNTDGKQGHNPGNSRPGI